MIKKLILQVVGIVLILTIFTSCPNNVALPSYDVTFETDGGTPVPDVQKVKSGDKAKKPATDPLKEGYVFLYWKDENSEEFTLKQQFMTVFNVH
ncbi:MAG: InlB B-repeat-containing protein [Treponema sp.]|nr:InlB B-repeat-containing protein [Treponema sp.]